MAAPEIIHFTDIGVFYRVFSAKRNTKYSPKKFASCEQKCLTDGQMRANMTSQFSLTNAFEQKE